MVIDGKTLSFPFPTDGVSRASDYPAAAAQCTSACSTLCAKPNTSFTSMDSNVISRDFPVATPKTAATTFHDPTGVITLKTHATETWWLDARNHVTYCQWSWTSSRYSDPLSVASEVYMADRYDGSTKQRRWPDYTGKYYNRSWDEVQDWLSLEPDPVVLENARLPAVWNLSGFVYCTWIRPT